MKQTARCAKDGRASPAERQPAPQEPALARHVPLHSLCHAGQSAAGKSQWRGFRVISLRYIKGQIVCVAPKKPSHHSRHASDSRQTKGGNRDVERSGQNRANSFERRSARRRLAGSDEREEKRQAMFKHQMIAIRIFDRSQARRILPRQIRPKRHR